MTFRVKRFDAEAFRRLIRGDVQGLGPSAARLGLGVASTFYGTAARARNLFHDLGLPRVGRAGVPVISVGNLTTGGTGKTPTVEWVARRYRTWGKRVAVLSRGYGRTDGLNDEGLVLEENLPDVPHLQGKDRVKLSEIAVEELESEILVLDDGFQHRRLHRDLDIVLIDALDPFGGDRLIPRGLLREPASSLRRANLVILTRRDAVSNDVANRLLDRIGRLAPRAGIAAARHMPVDLIDADGRSHALESLAGKRVAAFCGIGNPDGFRRTLELLGCPPASFLTFPDHHEYSERDVSELSRWSAEHGADLILTTQKDFVKLRLPSLGLAPLRALRIGIEFVQGRETVENALSRLLSP